MALPLVALARVLRAAGLTVVEHDGWTTRNRGADEGFAPRALIWHHDASAPGDSPGVVAFMLNPANNGAQMWVSRSGVWHLLAAGRMHHAGTGIARGVIRANRGNDDSAGIETDHTTGEDWPPALLDSLRRGTAAIMRHYGWSADDALWGHKETAPGRKPDPDGLDMAHERRTVAALIEEDDDMPTAREIALAVHGYRNPDVVGPGMDFYRIARETHAAAVKSAQLSAANQAALAALAKNPDITPAQLSTTVDAAVKRYTPTAEQVAAAQLPHIQDAVRAVLGEDNADQADAIVRRIGERLANPDIEEN